MVEHLAASGYDIVATDISYRDDLAVELDLLDLRDRVAVIKRCVGMDAVVHLANHPNHHSLRPASRVLWENTEMTTNVFDAVVQTGVRRVVYASSVQAMHGPRNFANYLEDPPQPSPLAYLPLDGNAPPLPSNPYGLSKVTAEQMLAMVTRNDPECAGVAVRFPALFTKATPDLYWDPEEIRRRRFRASWIHVDEGFAYLTYDASAALIRALLENMQPGYDCVLPAMDDNLLGWPAERVAAEFYAGVEVRRPLAGRRGLVDTSAITERYGWKPPQLDHLQLDAAS